MYLQERSRQKDQTNSSKRCALFFVWFTTVFKIRDRLISCGLCHSLSLSLSLFFLSVSLPTLSFIVICPYLSTGFSNFYHRVSFRFEEHFKCKIIFTDYYKRTHEIFFVYGLFAKLFFKKIIIFFLKEKIDDS